MKKQEFEFHYPLKHKVVRDLKITTEHVGDLIVTGTAYFNPSAPQIDTYDRYAVDIDFIKWNGTDIKDVLEVLGTLDEIEEAAIRATSEMFEKEREAA